MLPTSTWWATAAGLIVAVALLHHIAVLRQRNAALARDRFDSVTGLLGRDLFMDAAGRYLTHTAHLHSTVALLVDLDRFKQVNDEWGHHAGNIVLHVIGGRLRFHLGDNAVVSRLGGDEFAALMQAGPVTGDWTNRIDALHEALTAPIEISPRGAQTPVTVTVEASVGAVHLSAIPRPVLSGVLNLADEQSRIAKFAGGGVATNGNPDPVRVQTPADQHPPIRMRDTRPSRRGVVRRSDGPDSAPVLTSAGHTGALRLVGGN